MPAIRVDFKHFEQGKWSNRSRQHGQVQGVTGQGVFGRDGVCVLASVSEVGRQGEIDLGAWNRQMVLGNRLVFGTVNAGRRHFEAAVRDLAVAEERRPGWMERLINRRLPFTEAARALVRAPEDIKTVLDFG